MQQLKYIAPCHFGLESVLAGELRRMDAQDVKADNGRVEFKGDFNILARANISLRTAERILIKLGEFKATTFEELFQGVKAIPLEDFIGKKDAFPVKGWSLNSKLYSVPDCQSIIKKACVERLKSHYRQDWFSETGSLHQIQFSILKDKVTIMMDTSGVGLHKRGYRRNSNEAPIKETLASGIIDLARVKHYSMVCDPFCGSGTFLIESAMKALNIPPCLRRKFIAQDWGLFSENVWKEERSRGLELIKKDAEFTGFGSDIDKNAVELTINNAKKAGVLGRLSIKTADVKEYITKEKLITFANPPYGERMLEKEQARKIYKTMGTVFKKFEQNSYYIISADEEFEKIFGRVADKKRKLYNGMLKCNLYQYFK